MMKKKLLYYQEIARIKPSSCLFFLQSLRYLKKHYNVLIHMTKELSTQPLCLRERTCSEPSSVKIHAFSRQNNFLKSAITDTVWRTFFTGKF